MNAQTTPMRLADLYRATCDQKTKTVPVVVPFGTSVESVLTEFYDDGFFLDGPPVLGGATDAGNVYSVTLRRTPESVALVRGIDGLIALSETIPKAEKRLDEIHSGTEGNPDRADLYRTLYGRVEADALKAAADLEQLAGVIEDPKLGHGREFAFVARNLRTVASHVRGRWA